MKDKNWTLFLEYIKQTFPIEFSTYFSNYSYHWKDPNTLVLEVASDFLRARILKKYPHVLTQFLTEHSLPLFSMDVNVNAGLKEKAQSASASSKKAENSSNQSVARAKEHRTSAQPKRLYPLKRIIEENTFERFIVGQCNDMAHLAAEKICRLPGTLYNPLYIYSETGLGKTHLLHSIAISIHQRHIGKKIIYATAEQFMWDFVRSVKQKSKGSFYNIYRDADVLLLDDIQQIENWEKTQDELELIYNDLMTHKKQLVLAGDRPPASLQLNKPKMISRLNAGLVVEMVKPDAATRRAFIQILAEEAKLTLKSNVEHFLVESFTENYRDIQAAMTKLAFTKQVTGQFQFSLEDIQLIVKDLLYQRQTTPYLTVEHIIQETARFFNISISQLKGKKRTQDLAKARQLAMYLTRIHTDMSTTEIGKAFGGRNHSTVLNAVKKMEALKESDASIQHSIKEIKNRLTLLGF